MGKDGDKRLLGESHCREREELDRRPEAGRGRLPLAPSKQQAGWVEHWEKRGEGKKGKLRGLLGVRSRHLWGQAHFVGRKEGTFLLL